MSRGLYVCDLKDVNNDDLDTKICEPPLRSDDDSRSVSSSYDSGSVKDSKASQKPKIRPNNGSRKKKSKFPAIKVVKLKKKGNFPLTEVQYFVPHSMYYDPAKIAILNKYHPCELNDLHRYNSYNRHPLCAAFRSIGEAHIITCIQQELMEHRITDATICDVGGSVNRHHSLKRDYIHSCVPLAETKDLIRCFNLKGNSYCRNDWQNCECRKFAASMSIHSLYYLEPEEILKKLLQQQLPVHYALLHRYKHDDGEIMHGEMSYIRRNNQVRVWAKGNETPYVHSDMSWLDASSFVCDSGTLVWELERTFEDVYVYRFVASSQVLSVNKEEPNEPEPVDNGVYYRICKDAFRGHLEMNEKNRSAYLTRVTRYSKGLNLDPKKLISLADKYYMDQEVILSRPSINFEMVKRARSLALDLTPIHVSYIRILVMCLCYWLCEPFVGSTWLFEYFSLSFSGLLFVAYNSGFFYAEDRWFNLFVITGLFFSISSNMLVRFFVDNVLQLPTYFKMIFSVIAFMVTCYRYGRKLSLSLCKYKLYDYCCEGLQLRPFSDRKLLKYKPKKPHDCKPGIRAYPFVFSRKFVPMMPRRCDHNFMACIQHKLLAETPENVKFDIPIPSFFYDMARRMEELIPLSFDQWVSRFPSSKEKKLREEWEALEDEVVDSNINDTNLFLKAEFYPEIKPPRPIGASNVLLNFLVGRWLVPLGEAIQALTPNNVMIPIHSDSLEIGHFASKYMHFLKCMCDFGQFDSTQREEALQLIVSVFRLLGVPADVCDLMLLDCERISVSTRKGHRFVCKGFRVSGRSETLLGNCILTICIFSHIVKDYIAMLGKGDDVVLFLPHHYISKIDSVVDKIHSYGFISKFKVCDEYDLEFCSSYFIPTARGLMLTPKPGKILAKTLWTKNTNLKEHEQMAQFAGIVKGMANNFFYLPFIENLSKRIEYGNYSHVEAIQYEYQEYSKESTTWNQSTIDWMLVKYDLGYEHMYELGRQLAEKPFPIELDCLAADVMMECDWGPPNHSSLLSHVRMEDSVCHVFVCALVEEIARAFSPMMVSLLLGGYESYHTQTLFNLIAHLLLGVIAHEGYFIVAFVLHFAHNLGLGSRGPKLNMVKTKTKKQLSNEIASLKGQLRRKPKKANTRQSSMKKIAKMVSDPCNCELYPGFHSTDEGILSRLKTRFSVSSVDTNGFVLWCPTYASENINGKASNAFIFQTSSSTTNPINTTANPFGSGLSGDPQGHVFKAGAAAFCNSSTVADQRSVGACMSIEYFGRMDSAAGQIAIVDNLSAEALLDDGAGTISSVDDLFTRASYVKRFAADRFEVKHRPDSSSHLFKTERDGVVTVGTPTSSSSVITSESLRFGPRLIGFAWKGVSSNADLFFEFYQNIEWRPNTTTGFVSVIPKQIYPTGLMERVLKYLDDNHPGWEYTAVSTTAALVSKMALAGVPQRQRISL